MTAFFVLEELFYQPFDVDAEEYLFRQRRFLENGADNDIQTGKLAGQTVKFTVIILSGVCFCKNSPKGIQLFLGHVKYILNLFHRCIDHTYLIKVTYVKHGISVSKTVQVYPVILIT